MPYVTLSDKEQEGNLELLVAMLNDQRAYAEDRNYRSEDVVKLRRLMHAWRAMMESTGGQQYVQGMKLSRSDQRDLQGFSKGLQVTLEWDGSLKVHDAYPHPFDSALIHFARFLYNGRQDYLGGPCAGLTKGKACDLWFVKNDLRQEFCSSKCNGNARQARRRADVHKRKLKKALRALDNYPGRPPRFKAMDWKQYVNQATGISKRFLTRIVDSGELIEPNGSQS